MKKDRKKIKSALLEILAETILTVICFGIGVLILRLFGVNLDFSDTDPDLIVLLGIVVAAVTFGIAYGLTQWFKKIIRKKGKTGK